MRSVKKLFYTTLALTLTGLVMRTVGVWFNVYLTGLMGTAGIGVFQLILSVYAMAKTLAYAGMNLGATRLCIDDQGAMRHSVRRVLACSLFMGGIAMFALHQLAPFLSSVWMNAPDAEPSLRILSCSLPFVSMSAGINGYMTAARKLGRYSVIQLLEQLCRIASTGVLVALLGTGIQGDTLSLVSWGITISEVFSFSLCILSFLFDVKKQRMPTRGKPGFLKRFCRIAVPDAIGAYVRSGLNTVEHLLIPWGLRRSGSSVESAFSDYGIVQGMALPVLLYPSAILTVISSLLVPEIAECKAMKNTAEIRYMINRVLQITAFFSIACAIAVFLYAKTFSEAIFHSGDAAPFMRVLAPLIPVMYMDMTTDGMLKGLDRQLTLMKINVLDSLLCVSLVYFLVPKTAVNGYIITIYAAEIINFLLSFGKLSRETKLSLRPVRGILLPTGIAYISFQITKVFTGITKDPTPGLVLACGIGSVVYLILLYGTGCISKEDIAWGKGLIKPSPFSGSRNEAVRLPYASSSVPE